MAGVIGLMLGEFGWMDDSELRMDEEVEVEFVTQRNLHHNSSNVPLHSRSTRSEPSPALRRSQQFDWVYRPNSDRNYLDHPRAINWEIG
jgi:hypothetical protein